MRRRSSQLRSYLQIADGVTEATDEERTWCRERRAYHAAALEDLAVKLGAIDTED